MKKATLLTTSLVILVVLNLILISSIFFDRGKSGHEPNRQMYGGPQGPRPREVIIETLGFSKDQILKYDILIKEHRRKINQLDKEIRINKEKLYNLLASSFNNNVKDSLINVINVNQKQIEETHFNHFEAIKNICSEKQKAAFEELVPELPGLFGPKHPQGRP